MQAVHMAQMEILPYAALATYESRTASLRELKLNGSEVIGVQAQAPADHLNGSAHQHVDAPACMQCVSE